MSLLRPRALAGLAVGVAATCLTFPVATAGLGRLDHGVGDSGEAGQVATVSAWMSWPSRRSPA